MTQDEKELTQEEKEKLAELNVRRMVAMQAVRIVVDAKNHGDPRGAAAEEKYRGQLKRIEERIEAITGRPPDIVIGLKTAQLSAEPSKLGR